MLLIRYARASEPAVVCGVLPKPSLRSRFTFMNHIQEDSGQSKLPTRQPTYLNLKSSPVPHNFPSHEFSYLLSTVLCHEAAATPCPPQDHRSALPRQVQYRSAKHPPTPSPLTEQPSPHLPDHFRTSRQRKVWVATASERQRQLFADRRRSHRTLPIPTQTPCGCWMKTERGLYLVGEAKHPCSPIGSTVEHLSSRTPLLRHS